MNREPQSIQLTPLQIAHTITALRPHVKALENKGDEDPEGGEYTVETDGLFSTTLKKVTIATVKPGLPAEKAGLLAGDEIVAANDTPWPVRRGRDCPG